MTVLILPRGVCVADCLLNLRNALIGGDVRGPCRVQGLILLRFFAYVIIKTVFFDNYFNEYSLQNGVHFTERNSNTYNAKKTEKRSCGG